MDCGEDDMSGDVVLMLLFLAAIVGAFSAGFNIGKFTEKKKAKVRK